MIRRPPRSTPLYSSAASDVYKRQEYMGAQLIQKWQSVYLNKMASNRAAEIEALKGTKKYTWGGVINFLQDQQHAVSEHDTEWMIEKQELQSKIASLEGELRAQERINRDLLKRVKMLEYALRQERIKYGRSALAEDSEVASDPMGESKAEEPEVKLAKRKAQRHRDMLKKYCAE
eukprot:TRINITY_DN16490_c0_g3_i3.p3 TRINITY_DN16490_c0_g3~~TRINITY_DN16490_c0_g3_i3.p3  ORF type:complete len:182 (+),score=79.80 TRINITY_DN16490_c0_g3_i3:23-547(+)